MSIQSLQVQASELLDKKIERQARDILAQYRRARDEIDSILKTNYSKYLIGVEPNTYWAVLNQYQRLEKMNKEIAGIYTKLTNGVFKEVKDGQIALFEESYYRKRFVTEAFAVNIGGKVSRQALNPLITELSVTGDLEIWKQIKSERLKEIALGIVPKTGKTLKEILSTNSTDDLIKLQQVIKQGLITGESYNKQIEKVKGVFNNSAYKTQRVIRTEGNRNLNAGAQVERETSGVVKKKRWLATLDSSTRDTHQMLDGQTVGVNERFSINGDTALYPGNFSSASENINCRCSIIDIIEGLEPTVRRAKDPLTGKSDIISYKNYDEWKENYPNG